MQQALQHVTRAPNLRSRSESRCPMPSPHPGCTAAPSRRTARQHPGRRARRQFVAEPWPPLNVSHRTDRWRGSTYLRIFIVWPHENRHACARSNLQGGGPLRVCFIRHGETAWSLSGQHSGGADLPLTPRGESMARSPASTLSGISFSITRLQALTARWRSRESSSCGTLRRSCRRDAAQTLLDRCRGRRQYAAFPDGLL